MPMLVKLVKAGRWLVPERLLRASDFADALAKQQSGMEDGRHRRRPANRRAERVRSVSAGARRESGISRRRTPKGAMKGCAIASLSKGAQDDVSEVGFPYFAKSRARLCIGTDHPAC
jgi:nitrate reductase alpha subunit